MTFATSSLSAITADRYRQSLAPRLLLAARYLSFGLFGLMLAFTSLGAKAAPNGAEGTPPAPPLDIVAFTAWADLDALFDQRDFSLDDVRAGLLAVPRLYVTELPQDLKSIEDAEQRKDLFLRTLLPLVLMENERILSDRLRLERLIATLRGDQPVEAGDLVWLDHMAEYYETDASDLDELLSRIDVVPVSMTLAQAIEESGWGTSRYAQKGNALFGQRTWSQSAPALTASQDGVPLDHKARAFADLMGSVQAYMHNLNTHRAYRKWRDERALQREEFGQLDPHVLTEKLSHYAENEAYAENLQRLIRHNDLEDFDRARLATGALAERRDLQGDFVGPSGLFGG